jgi:fructokinase
MSIANSPIMLTAGEALIDLIQEPDGRYFAHAGGAVFNAARAFALLGVPTAYLNPISRDRFGQLLQAELSAAGVISPWATPVAQPTSLAVVSINQQGGASYGFYREGIADKAIDASTLIGLTDQFANTGWAMTGCLALTADSTTIYLPWLTHCKARGIKIVVDANMRPVVTEDQQAYRESVMAALAVADVIKASDEDLDALQISNPSQLWQRTQAQVIVITRAAAGATVHSRSGFSTSARESRPMTVVDTVGAGDCFLAGFVGHLAQQSDWQANQTLVQALAQGIAAASINVQRRGCQPATKSEVQAWLA